MQFISLCVMWQSVFNRYISEIKLTDFNCTQYSVLINIKIVQNFFFINYDVQLFCRGLGIRL